MIDVVSHSLGIAEMGHSLLCSTRTASLNSIRCHTGRQ